MADDSDEPTTSRSWRPILAVSVFAVIAYITYAANPLFHDFVMFFYANPWILEAVVVTILITVAYAKWTDSNSNTASDAVFVAGVTFIGLIIVFGILAMLFSSHAMGQETMSDSATIETMYEGDADHPRIVTRQQARQWGSGSLQTSQFQTSGSSIVVYNNTTYWASNLIPDGSIRNTFTEKQNGTVLVNAETFEKDVKVIHGDMDVGRGMQITDNVEWKLEHATKGGPWLVNYHYGAQRPIVHNGDQYLMVPYTKPHHHLLPVANSHPSEGGVALLDADGNVEHLSLDEARDEAVLDGQPLMPPALVRQKVAATTYRSGIVDTLPVIGQHETTLSISNVPGAENQQPFYFRTADHGAQYVIAAEPTGDTQGLRELWFTDTRTGEMSMYQSPSNSTMYGPRKSSDFVIDANDRTDWSRFTPSEPIPTVVDGDLYWQFRVVQEGGGGITFVSMVNAESQSVVNIEDSETASAVSAFMRGEDVGVENPTIEPGESEREPVMVVEKKNESGEVVETLYVYENETIVTRSADGNETADSG